MGQRKKSPPMSVNSVNIGHIDSSIKDPGVYMRFFYPATVAGSETTVLLFNMTADFTDRLARSLKNQAKKVRKPGRTKQSWVGKEITAAADKLEIGE